MSIYETIPKPTNPALMMSVLCQSSQPSVPHNLEESLENIIFLHTVGIDCDGIAGWPQPTGRSFHIVFIPLLLESEYFIVIGVHTGIQKLPKTASRSFLGGCRQKYFARGIWKSDGPLVASLCHHILSLNPTTLSLDHGGSHLQIVGDRLDRSRDFWRSNRNGDVFAIHPNRVFSQFDCKVHGDLCDSRWISEWDIASQACQRHATIHRAGVEKREAEYFR
jgi:hypothetical protein